ncbi:FUN14 domain-containing protein 1A-like [Gigantopelta aegis]|uniref:FUN14 domain-containing protein 1A-like n=1 Tax=Gigantopelta aegis TaxID=1735272 RepID=UPI001B88E616|nr:FUN14 domain-containing protein 1A-like [Gigantopelta aegis]XP_041357781.1 FUN14 domain-containing protein 1A-like [Gigantopelta aegis]
MADRTGDWLGDILGDVTKQSAATQAIIGGAAGWGAGFLLVRFGTMAALSFGMSILLLQFAQHQGYINITWPPVDDNMYDNLRSQIQNEYRRQYSGVQRFAQNNIVLATAFGGGFFFGVSYFSGI